MYWAGKRLGESRLWGAYAWRSLLDTGVIVPNGSDFPVERVNPLYSFHAAVTRQDENDFPPGGWYPAQRMTREEALQSMTLWPAYAGLPGEGARLPLPGQVRRLRRPRPATSCAWPPRRSSAPGCVATYLGGKPVYQRP